MKKEERLITISDIADKGWMCDVEGCMQEAEYMGGGRVRCSYHWAILFRIPEIKDDE